MAVLKFGMDLGLLGSQKILDSLRQSLEDDDISENEIIAAIAEAK